MSQNIVGGITQTASAAPVYFFPNSNITLHKQHQQQSASFSKFQTQTLSHCALLWDRSGEKSNAKKTSEREKTHWRDSGPFLYPRPLWTSVTLHKGCASEKSRKSLFNMFWHSCCELWQEHFTLHHKRSRSPLLSDFPLPWYHQRWKKEMKKAKCLEIARFPAFLLFDDKLRTGSI